MEPVTHALTSLALSRAGLNKTSRLATPMLLVSGLVADLDWLSQFGGARAFLEGHRTTSHSLVGTAIIALAVAGLFWWVSKKYLKPPLRFDRALLVCAAGAGAHLLCDLANSYGVKLLWPFRATWYAWDLVDTVDPWILGLLLLGLLLPGLFGLVSEEIGARPKRRGARRGAIVALALVVLFVAGRALLHDRAALMLNSRVYRGESPLEVGAFPQAGSPLFWSGVVETENALADIEVPLAPGTVFDPFNAQTHFKPEPSPALEAARKSAAFLEFMQFARFPLARVTRTEYGYRVEVRDLRFTSRQPGRRSVVAYADVNHQAQVINEGMRFEMPAGRGR